MTTCEDISFDDWLEEVDRLIQEKVGVSLYDLPDQRYRDWFEDGFDPVMAMEYVLDNEL